LTAQELPKSLFKHQYRHGTRSRTCKKRGVTQYLDRAGKPSPHKQTGGSTIPIYQPCQEWNDYTHIGGTHVGTLSSCDTHVAPAGYTGAAPVPQGPCIHPADMALLAGLVRYLPSGDTVCCSYPAVSACKASGRAVK